MDFDFLSNNLQLAYPFKDIVTVTRPSGSADIRPLVAAIRVYTYDQRLADLYVDEVDLRSSDNFYTLDTASLTLRWSDDDSQFTLTNGVNAIAKVVKYGAWVVVRWRHTSMDFVFHIVFPLAAVETGATYTMRFWKQTDDVTVLAALVKQGPEKIRRVYIKRGNTLTQIAGPGDELSVQPGFNMELDQGEAADTTEGRKLTRVAINAVPGAGLGRYLICRGNEYLLTLNGVGPDDVGNVALAPEECYWLDIPIASGPSPVTPEIHNISREATLRPNQVRLRNSCGPCCSCEDYVATYDHLRSIWNKARAVASRINVLRGRYGAAVNTLNEVQPTDDVLTLFQTSDTEFTVRVTAWNNSADLIEDSITITLEFTLPSGVTFSYTFSVVSGLGDARYIVPTDPGTKPNITISDDIRPYESFWWYTSWKLTGVSIGDTVEVTAVISGGMSKTSTRELVWEDQ